MEKILNFINGDFHEPQSGNYFENFNPSTGKPYSLIPDSGEKDVDAAVSFAANAFSAWAHTPAGERAKILLRIADGISKNLEMLAKAESIDNGKPLKLSRTVDIPRAAANFHFYATAIEHFASEAHSMEDRAINYTLRQPIGPVACISPWNLPLYLFSWKIAPALAAGCTVVAKPSEVTPMTSFLLSKIVMDAGLPPGVLNIIHGTGKEAGSAMVKHPGLHAISFTGGTKTGADIARVAAPMFKKLSLELGGKNPNIIFADCDFEEMMRTTLHSSFSNQGQICLCGSRIYIERPLYDRFKEEFVARTRKLVVGDPFSETTHIGAVVSKEHMEKILGCIERAKSEGGTIVTGGNRIRVQGGMEEGWYVQPTIIEGLPHDCKTNQEEIFGPVVTIAPFDSEEEVLKFANSTNYGLAATLWTGNLTRAHKMAARIEAGIVWINCWLLRDLRTPFGGIKNSGVGREGGFEALRFFTEPRNICIKL